jgi:hypothetical protein
MGLSAQADPLVKGDSGRRVVDVELLRQAATQVASEWADREAGRLLLDAVTLAEFGA